MKASQGLGKHFLWAIPLLCRHVTLTGKSPAPETDIAVRRAGTIWPWILAEHMEGGSGK